MTEPFLDPDDSGPGGCGAVLFVLAAWALIGWTLAQLVRDCQSKQKEVEQRLEKLERESGEHHRR